MILSLVFVPLLLAVYIQTRLYKLQFATDAAASAVAPVATPSAVDIRPFHILTIPYSATAYENKAVALYDPPAKSPPAVNDLLLTIAIALAVYVVIGCIIYDTRYTDAVTWRSLMDEKLQQLKESVERSRDAAAAESLVELSLSRIELSSSDSPSPSPRPPPPSETSSSELPAVRRSLRRRSLTIRT